MSGLDHLVMEGQVDIARNAANRAEEYSKQTSYLIRYIHEHNIPMSVSYTHLDVYKRQGYGCSPFKVVRELGVERRETVRSLSAVGVGELRGVAPSTRGPEWTHHCCSGCHANGTAR